MAGRKLAANVFVDGEIHLAGSSPSKDVAEKISNPKAWGKGDAEAAPSEPEPAFPEGDPSDAWKVDQLKAYAANNEVDLGDATTKKDILAILGKA